MNDELYHDTIMTHARKPLHAQVDRGVHFQPAQRDRALAVAIDELLAHVFEEEAL